MPFFVTFIIFWLLSDIQVWKKSERVGYKIKKIRLSYNRMTLSQLTKAII